MQNKRLNCSSEQASCLTRTHLIKDNVRRGWQDVLLEKVLAHELDPWDAHCGCEELTPANCPLTCSHAVTHTDTQSIRMQ